MKEVKEDGKVHCAAIRKDWSSVKKVVAYMKRNGKNSQPPRGLVLHQEIGTRVRTVCDVLEKIIKAAPSVYEHLNDNTSKHVPSILTHEDPIRRSAFPYLQIFVDCFKPKRNVQRQLERTTSSTLQLIYRFLKSSSSSSKMFCLVHYIWKS